jgi:hypothetical protein
LQEPRLIKLLRPLNDLPTGIAGFFVMANVLDTQLNLPVDFTPSIHLDRADYTQILEIQQSLCNYEYFNIPKPGRLYYEADWIPYDNGGQTQALKEPDLINGLKPI